jgi:hypothetical protein
LKPMEFLNEEVDGAIIAQKIRGEYPDTPNYIPSAAALYVSSKQPRYGRKDRHKDEPVCVFCEAKGHWAQERKITSVIDYIEKLKSAHRCFLYLNRGHNARACNKRGKASGTKCTEAHYRSICNVAGTTTRSTDCTEYCRQDRCRTYQLYVFADR